MTININIRLGKYNKTIFLLESRFFAVIVPASLPADCSCYDSWSQQTQIFPFIYFSNQ